MNRNTAENSGKLLNNYKSHTVILFYYSDDFFMLLRASYCYIEKITCAKKLNYYPKKHYNLHIIKLF